MYNRPRIMTPLQCMDSCMACVCHVWLSETIHDAISSPAGPAKRNQSRQLGAHKRRAACVVSVQEVKLWH